MARGEASPGVAFELLVLVLAYISIFNRYRVLLNMRVSPGTMARRGARPGADKGTAKRASGLQRQPQTMGQRGRAQGTTGTNNEKKVWTQQRHAEQLAC